MTDHLQAAIDATQQHAKSQGGNIAFMVYSGSRAFGTNRPDSDWDFKGVYTAGLPQVLSLAGVAKTFNQTAPDDVTAYELHHFCKLAVAANPTVLETLWSDEGVWTPTGDLLKKSRDLFLSKKVYATYRGFAQGQRKKGMQSRKARMHALRLLQAGREALLTGRVTVRLAPREAQTLWEGADLKPEEFYALMTDQENELQIALGKSELPELPDYKAIDELIYTIRLKGVANAKIEG